MEIEIVTLVINGSVKLISLPIDSKSRLIEETLTDVYVVSLWSQVQQDTYLTQLILKLLL